jgi:hypothetical protein
MAGYHQREAIVLRTPIVKHSRSQSNTAAIEDLTMPFVFWGGTDAEVEFKKDLTYFYEKHGYKGSYPKSMVEDLWAKLRVWSKESRTATAMFEFIDQSPKNVHVVGMSGGFQCFSSTSGIDQEKGTIFVDLDAKIKILAQTTHNLHLPIKEMATIWKGSTGGKTWVDLDNNITLLHEIGHGKQWIEKPGWFDIDYRTETKKIMGQAPRDDDPKLKDISAREIYAKAKAMQEKTASGRGVKPLITQGVAVISQGSGVSTQIGTQTMLVRGARKPELSFLPERDEQHAQQKLEAPVGWSVPTEQDNMNRHEWPICREMGLPLRSNYGDIKLAGTAAAQQLTTMMKKWADEAAKAKAATMSARVGTVVKVCPECNGQFPSMKALFDHKRETGHG